MLVPRNHATTLAETLLGMLVAEIGAKLPPALSRADLDDFVRRHRSALIRLLAQAVSPAPPSPGRSEPPTPLELALVTLMETLRAARLKGEERFTFAFYLAAMDRDEARASEALAVVGEPLALGWMRVGDVRTFSGRLRDRLAIRLAFEVTDADLEHLLSSPTANLRVVLNRILDVERVAGVRPTPSERLERVLEELGTPGLSWEALREVLQEAVLNTRPAPVPHGPEADAPTAWRGLRGALLDVRRLQVGQRIVTRWGQHGTVTEVLVVPVYEGAPVNVVTVTAELDSGAVTQIGDPVFAEVARPTAVVPIVRFDDGKYPPWMEVWDAFRDLDNAFTRFREAEAQRIVHAMTGQGKAPTKKREEALGQMRRLVRALTAYVLAHPGVVTSDRYETFRFRWISLEAAETRTPAQEWELDRLRQGLRHWSQRIKPGATVTHYRHLPSGELAQERGRIVAARGTGGFAELVGEDGPQRVLLWMLEPEEPGATPAAERFPEGIDSPGRRALYELLGRDARATLAVDAAALGARQADWRFNPIKTRRVRRAIREALGTDDEARLDAVFQTIHRHPDDY